MKPGFFIGVAIFAVWLLEVPSSLAQAEIPSNDQLSSKDVQDIIALLGVQKEEDTAASQPVPTVVTSPKNSASSSSNNEASLNKDATLSQDELAQSLALLNTLFASNGQSPDLSALLGGALSPTTTTTTTTTENPKEAEVAAAQLLTALLGAGGNGAGGDAGNLAALLSLAAAGQTTQAGNKPAAVISSTADAQNAALLTNLLLSAGGQTGGIKQQDFQSFQNSAGSLDPSSSNQLSGALNLLSTLGTLGSLAGPQSSLLGGLLGGGNRQQSGILGLLSPQQQTQRPGLLASLGNLASVVGTTLGGVRTSLNLGPAKLRGVDTRLGLGYRFGENADAQVLWEIGPQLFTEPLTDEQKMQLKLQQEQLRLQQQQFQAQLQQQQQQQLAAKNPNRRLTATARRAVRVPRPMVASKTVSRRHAGQGAEGVVRPPTSKSSTIEQLLQPPPSLYRTSRPPMAPKPTKLSQLNYYAKQEANPRTNTNSQLTEYEQFLLHSPHRNQIHQQKYIVNSPPVPKQRKDAFTFTKDAKKNIVRVKVHRRQIPNHVQVIQAVGGLGNENSGAMMSPVDFSSRMGGFRRRTNPGSDESYLRRNAVAFNPRLREMQRKQEREEHQVRNIQRLQREQERIVRDMMKQGGSGGAERTRIFQRPQLQSKPNFLVPPASLGRNNSNRRVNSPRRRTGPARMDPKANPKTLSEWSEKNSFTDLISNFVVSRLKSTGNAVVSSILPGASLNLPDDDIPAEDAATEADTQVVVMDDTKTTGGATGIRAVMKGFLGLGKAEPKPSTPTPIIKIGEGVAYDELRSIVSGGKSKEAAPSLSQGSYRIPTLGDSETYEPVVHAKDKFPSPPPEIFIDIANGEVSMRKAFGTMESFTPPPPEHIPEDHPRHVFKVLKEQLAKQYEKVKLQQLREAAKQIRKENIANGLANPHDPLYMASGMFELMEKESKK